jgi:hypothetical protein
MQALSAEGGNAMSGAIRISRCWLMAALAAAVAIPAWAGDATSSHSGTVVAVDKPARTLVLAEVGPWQVKDGEPRAVRRVVAVTDATEFIRVKRAAGVAPSGWPGDYVATPLPAWQVKPGDFVTVEARHEGQRLVALRITVADPREP